MKALDGLSWKPRWVSALGCYEGCLDFLGIEVSTAWAYGVSGHAFVMNISPDLCPSGPTAWNTDRFWSLRQHVGAHVETICGFKSKPNFGDLQARAWDAIRAAVDAGTPCFGWELEIPEYYVIHGYDETGYYFRGPMCNDGKGPKPWAKLGATDIQWLEVGIVTPGPVSDDRSAVREAIEFALAWARPDNRWRVENYVAGLEAYDAWIHSLRSGTAHALGAAYNAQVWTECRQNAARFLEEARSRLGASAPLDDAIAHYAAVAERLTAVSNAFPFVDPSSGDMERHVKDPERCASAADALSAARAEEEKGLEALGRVLSSP